MSLDAARLRQQLELFSQYNDGCRIVPRYNRSKELVELHNIPKPIIRKITKEIHQERVHISKTKDDRQKITVVSRKSTSSGHLVFDGSEEYVEVEQNT